MGARAHLMAARALPAAPVGAQQRGRERARRHRPARPRRPGEQPGVRHAQDVLAAQQPGRDGRGLVQLGDDPLLADQVSEDRRAAHRRVPVHAQCFLSQTVRLNRR